MTLSWGLAKPRIIINECQQQERLTARHVNSKTCQHQKGLTARQVSSKTSQQQKKASEKKGISKTGQQQDWLTSKKVNIKKVKKRPGKNLARHFRQSAIC
ncbi:MAG: hypothetical protein PUF78_00820 [Lachnospiraceae bacterium]|nr:hypothetical protein [Lachnospiraceae bacterium]